MLSGIKIKVPEVFDRQEVPPFEKILSAAYDIRHFGVPRWRHWTLRR